MAYSRFSAINFISPQRSNAEQNPLVRIVIFVGGGDVIVWGKLPSFTGWLTSPYRRVTFPHNLHHADVYINRKVMTLPPQIINDDIENIDL